MKPSSFSVPTDEKKVNSRFGFSLEKANISAWKWDKRILHRSKSLWGKRSVETSIQFIETYE
jgi:hypothetical protein